MTPLAPRFADSRYRTQLISKFARNARGHHLHLPTGPVARRWRQRVARSNVAGDATAIGHVQVGSGPTPTRQPRARTLVRTPQPALARALRLSATPHRHAMLSAAAQVQYPEPKRRHPSRYPISHRASDLPHPPIDLVWLLQRHRREVRAAAAPRLPHHSQDTLRKGARLFVHLDHPTN